jgi:hypothetical protein
MEIRSVVCDAERPGRGQSSLSLVLPDENATVGAVRRSLVEQLPADEALTWMPQSPL